MALGRGCDSYIMYPSHDFSSMGSRGRVHLPRAPTVPGPGSRSDAEGTLGWFSLSGETYWAGCCQAVHSWLLNAVKRWVFIPTARMNHSDLKALCLGASARNGGRVNPRNDLHYLELFSVLPLSTPQHVHCLRKGDEACLLSNKSPSIFPQRSTWIYLAWEKSHLAQYLMWSESQAWHIIMLMWMPNTDMGKGETYIALCREKLDHSNLLEGLWGRHRHIWFLN